jgi:hypothetical protein
VCVWCWGQRGWVFMHIHLVAWGSTGFVVLYDSDLAFLQQLEVYQVCMKATACCRPRGSSRIVAQQPALSSVCIYIVF